MQKILLFLGELNNEDLDWIIEKGKKETIPPGKTLIREGQIIDALYIVLSGSLSVEIESLGNKELAKISAGEVVGEISFIDSRPPLATVKAVEPSSILSISRMHLTSRLLQDMSFAARFYHAISLCLSERMRGTVRRLGYGEDLDDINADQNDLTPAMQDNLKLAEAKFNWLIMNAKESGLR